MVKCLLGILSWCLSVRVKNSKNRNFFGKLSRLFKAFKMADRFTIAQRKVLKKENGLLEIHRR